MALMNGIFSRPQKEDSQYVDDLSRDVESLNFGAPSTPKKGYGDGSFMQICSPDRSPQQQQQQQLAQSFPINYGINNKENTPSSSPGKLQLRSNNLFQTSRLDRAFYTKANSPKTKRLVTVCQMYFLDYYCDMFDYVISRQQRIQQVESSLNSLPQEERSLQWRNYVGRERAFLRKRRIKPKHKDFDIITQVGQGGYGQVFLARKKIRKKSVP